MFAAAASGSSTCCSEGDCVDGPTEGDPCLPVPFEARDWRVEEDLREAGERRPGELEGAEEPRGVEGGSF